VLEADRWMDRLDERLALWATQPKIGRERKELAPGIRSLPFGRCVVSFTRLDMASRLFVSCMAAGTSTSGSRSHAG